MRTNLSLIAAVTILVSLVVQGQDSQPNQSPSPAKSPNSNVLSPDKKWEYSAGDKPKLVNAGTNEVAVDFSEGCGLGALGEDAAVLWAPDSRRLAFFSCGQGKEQLTLVYELRDDQWVAIPTLGDGDDLMQEAGNVIKAQAKKKGLPKKTFLHMNSWTVKPDHWPDSNTLVVYASMMENAHKNDGEYAGDGFGADLLVTLKFDADDNWQIAATHRMSHKEGEKRTNKP